MAKTDIESDTQRVTLDVPREWLPVLEREGKAERRSRAQQMLYLIDPFRREVAGEAPTRGATYNGSASSTQQRPFVQGQMQERQQERCKHPSTRRIGTGCGICFKDPV